MPNRIVNFQMQQPGEMPMPQVGVQQQTRLSLAERLRKYGMSDQSGAQSFSDSFDQQMRQQPYPQQEASQSPQQQDQRTLPQQQQAGQIMNAYNAKGGGSEMGWKPSSPRSAQPGMMGSVSRGMDNVSGAVGSGTRAIGRGAGNVSSSVGKGLGAAGSAIGKGIGSFGKLFA